MKVLIVEDSKIKQTDVIQLLKRYHIEEIVVEKFVSRAIERLLSMHYDLLITDLGLPRFLDFPTVEDEREGLKMLFDLEQEGIKIPTLIYSNTDIYEEQVEYLEEIKYPIYGQSKSIEELEFHLVNLLQGNVEPIMPKGKSFADQPIKVKKQ